MKSSHSVVSIVTGGGGFIGSHLCARLLAEGHRVIAIDNFSTGRRSNLDFLAGADRFELVENDAGDSSLSALFLEADFIFHQAAIPSVPRSFAKPFLSNDCNISLTLKLLETIKSSKKIKKFVFASSSSVYGNTPVLPKVETMPPDPLSPYATQKFASERYCQIYSNTFGTPTVSLRYFNVFGPRQDPTSDYSAVIPKFIKLIKARSKLSVFGDGKQTRDFTYVDNVVQANILAAAHGVSGRFYNVASGHRISLLELIKELEKLAGYKVEFELAPRRQGDVQDSLAALDLAKTDMGYEAKISFLEGLSETWKSFN